MSIAKDGHRSVRQGQAHPASWHRAHGPDRAAISTCVPRPAGVAVKPQAHALWVCLLCLRVPAPLRTEGETPASSMRGADGGAGLGRLIKGGKDRKPATSRETSASAKLGLMKSE